MRPKRWTYTLAALDADGFLNDATGVGPWTTILANPADGTGHQVTITSAANLAAITLTVAGTDPEGRSISEAITGPGAGLTVTSTKFFKTVTSVTASATLGASTMDVGWNAVCVTPIVPVNQYASVGPLLGVDIGGTVNYDGQATNGNVYDLANATLFWEAISGMSGATADVHVNPVAGATAVRVKVNSHTSGTLAVTVSQGA